VVPGSRHAMHNIGKVVGVSDNVSKTEMTYLKSNALLVTSAKTHDGIDFDQSMSNDTMESTVSNDRKSSTYGNMYKDLSTKHTFQDISIQSLIKTSTIQNLGSMEQPYNVPLTMCWRMTLKQILKRKYHYWQVKTSREKTQFSRRKR